MKKISLFFTTPVRQRMEKDPVFARSPALLKAMRKHYELIEAGLQRGLDDESAKNIGGGAWKLFGQCRCESDSVQKAIGEAWRIESTVGFYPNGFNVEINFYGKASGQKSFFTVSFALNSDGIIGASSYSPGSY